MYIKGSSLVLGVHGLLRLSHTHTHTHTLCDFTAVFQSEEQIGGKKEQNRISRISSHQAEPSGLNIKQLSHWLSIVSFWAIFLFFFFFHIRTQICWLQIRHTRFFYLFIYFLIARQLLSRASSSPARPHHIWATVHHGDQHGHAPRPSAAFGDGGVPPVSGHSVRLQGRTTRAPPPLRTVWHHRGGGGGLLHPGGGPSPAVLLADRGEPEEEHQMSSSEGTSSMTVTCLTYLASLQPDWGTNR